MEIFGGACLFCLAVVALAYLPGKLLLLFLKQSLLPLEDFTLASLLGLLLSSLVYWLTVFAHQGTFYLLWPLGIVVAFVSLYARQRKELFRLPNAITSRVTRPDNRDKAAFLLAGVLGLGVLALAILPHYYTNMMPRTDGSMRVHPLYDVFLHLSIANELTHSIPPTAPVFAGHSLNYHYGMDLTVAMFAKATGLRMTDLMLRFMPTLFLVLSMLSVYCFSRAWLKSGYFAALVVFLVFFGEDFSFIPGWILGERNDWSVRFFNVPSVLSLYYINSMLPGVGLLFAGLFCLQKYLREHSRTWLILSALLFVSLMEVKLFTAVQIMFSLGIGAILYLCVFKVTDLFKVAALTAILTLPLIVPVFLSNKSGAGLKATLAPWPYVSIMTAALGVKSWCSNMPTFIGIALPVYLIGCLGLRTIGVPTMAKAVFRPNRSSGLRFVLAFFVIAGVIITLTCRIVPTGYPYAYNNSAWFLAQSKYVAWIFAVEVLQLLYGKVVALGVQPTLAALGTTIMAVALSVPSTVQHFALARYAYQLYGKAVMSDPTVYNAGVVQAMKFLASNAKPGDVVLPNERLLSPVLGLTECHVPIGYFANYLVAQDEFDHREALQRKFWEAWPQGKILDLLLREAHVRYVAVDKRSEGIPKVLPTDLKEVFANSECAIFKVQEPE